MILRNTVGKEKKTRVAFHGISWKLRQPDDERTYRGPRGTGQEEDGAWVRDWCTTDQGLNKDQTGTEQGPSGGWTTIVQGPSGDWTTIVQGPSGGWTETATDQRLNDNWPRTEWRPNEDRNDQRLIIGDRKEEDEKRKLSKHFEKSTLGSCLYFVAGMTSTTPPSPPTHKK